MSIAVENKVKELEHRIGNLEQIVKILTDKAIAVEQPKTIKLPEQKRA